MGAKDSKRSCLSYEDAVKRMSDAELKRVCEAFKRLTGGGQLLSLQAFVQNVLGDGVPNTIAEWLYTACGGGTRGIALKDLICGLVLLTKGTQEEKIKFLWTLYCNDSGTHITRSEFQAALQIEGTLPPSGTNKPNLSWDKTLISLFGVGQDRVGFDHFRAWIQYNMEATILTKWLLSNPCVSLSSELETPTFYQTLAGVTHLEEQDICELEKCFWTLQSNSPSGNLDYNCVRSLICPPIPLSACEGLFLALDVNRDGHVDFKELCCGISAACRGPTAERMKFCFKIFDMDRDCYLNPAELGHMQETLLFVASENRSSYLHHNGDYHHHQSSTMSSTKSQNLHSDTLHSLKLRLDDKGGLSQEEFLVWSVEDNTLVEPLLELLFQVCHVSLGLKPQCRHDEYEIVMGWLEREARRGYHVGQFWYLISSDWWQSWLNHTTLPRTNMDSCSCRADARLPLEEGIVCDESLISNGTDCTLNSNEFNSNSMESVGDLLRGDNCSIASSSGVSSSSGTCMKRTSIPGPIENSNLVAEPLFKVGTLTGEGGRLKRDTPLVQHRDFELVPDSLWKALALWYGGPLPLPRQVIRQPGSHDVELELYPLNLKILRHQPQQSVHSQSWSNVVGVYGQAALNTAGITTNHVTSPRRYLAHVAAFSRLANVRQVMEFLCMRLALRIEDVRLWHIKDYSTTLLEDENASLQDLAVVDCDQILLEVRNKDLTWPEELGALAASGQGGSAMLSSERRPTISLPPGATGLHNLGNTCFMNAALQAVSNTRPLTLYFQRDAQLAELNNTNPLGTKGMVARRYAELCRELWAGSTRSVAPLKLRYCVTKHAPHLGGGGQHDSQELLAWLLDALHEDLNRVAHKQYTELKDSGGRPDEIVAEEAWQQHMARDHSIITDLFYGQLKSKVTCQTCGQESVRFDPFSVLSLPLPMESYTLCEVLVIRLDGETPTKYGLRLNSEAKYLELKEQLQHLCNIKPDRLLLAEIAYSQIKQVLSDDARISPSTALELYAYELPDCTPTIAENEDLDNDTDTDLAVSDSPLARSPENKNTSKVESRLTNGSPFKKSSISIHSTSSNSSSTDNSTKCPSYLIALHRKCVRQETYFLSQHKSKPSLFGLPLLLGCSANSTCQSMYEAAWGQVTRLLSPLPQSDQTNHATDCDDSLGYEFPFTLKAVLQGGQICAVCHWTQFCRGCSLPCTDELLFDRCKSSQSVMCIAIDWDPTALHLRYQSCREKLWLEDESVVSCRKLHTEPIDLDYCLRAFTSEERLEAKYHCSNCQDKQPATKKLQIWRLPPILIIHLKRFDYVNNKWVKTQKMVNFPFKDFDPTAYLASVPQETILRHKHLLEQRQKDELESSCDSQSSEKIVEETIEENGKENGSENAKLLSNGTPLSRSITAVAGNVSPAVITTDFADDRKHPTKHARPHETALAKRRHRLESTSLLRTPIIDEHLKDFHEHKLLPGQDKFDLKYQLYAVVSHSGQLNGGHYISYACNPNGNWYCYNDSSCREVLADPENLSNKLRAANMEKHSGCTPLSRRKNMKTSTESSIDSSNIGRSPRGSSTDIMTTSTSSESSSSVPKADAAVCDTKSDTSTEVDDSTATLISMSSFRQGRDDDGFRRDGGSLRRDGLRRDGDSLRRDSNSLKWDSDSLNRECDGLKRDCDSLKRDSDTLKRIGDSLKRDGDSLKWDSDSVSRNGSVYGSRSSLNNHRCAYSDVKIPKIDTSSAYILFYERSGLDYKPYLPEVVSNGQAVPEVELDENESELRKQLCSLQ